MIYCKTWLGVSHAPSVSSRLWGSPSIIVSHLSFFASVHLTHSVCPVSLVSLLIHPKVTLPFFHPQCFIPLPLEQSADIVLYRWLIIWLGVIMNPSQCPDRRLLSFHLHKRGLKWAIYLNFQTFGFSWQILLSYFAWRIWIHTFDLNRQRWICAWVVDKLHACTPSLVIILQVLRSAVYWNSIKNFPYHLGKLVWIRCTVPPILK